MRWLQRAWCVLAVAVWSLGGAQAWGAGEPAAPESAELETLSGSAARPFKVRNCWYLVSAEAPYRTYGSYLLVVRRLPIGPCTSLVRALEWSGSNSPPLVTVREGGELAIAWTIERSSWYPSRRTISWVSLYHLDPDTLDTVRSEVLPSTESRVVATALEAQGHRVIVHGVKTGRLVVWGQPAGGTGLYFSATYERFFDSYEAPTVVDSEQPPEGPGGEQPAPPAEAPYTWPMTDYYVLPFKVQNCWYFVHSRMGGRFGPQQLAIERLPVTGCVGQVQYLDYSWDMSTLRVATRGGSDIVLAYSVRRAPNFVPMAPTGLRFLHLSPQTLQDLRGTPALLTPTSPSGQGARAQVTELSFQGHRLVAKGTRTGPFVEVGETGSGTRFTATFERFLESDAPPAVVAY